MRQPPIDPQEVAEQQPVEADRRVRRAVTDRSRQVLGQAGKFSGPWLDGAAASLYLGFSSYKAFWEFQKRLNTASMAATGRLELPASRLGRRLRYATRDLDRVMETRLIRNS